jgi:ribose/xylose/arabinose/galactoside ABC-type transport system permease subunit
MTDGAEPPIDHFAASDDYLADVLEAEAERIDEVQTGLQAFMARLLAGRELAILLVTVLVFILFWAANKRFVSQFNLVGILRAMPTMGVVAVGMTFLLVSGEIDLSVGTNAGLCATIIAIGFKIWNIDPWIGFVGIVLIGLLVGTINGLLVTRFKLPSFVVTLGMLAVLRGIANAMSGGLTYEVPPETNNSFYKVFGGDILLPGSNPNIPFAIPNQFVIMLIVVVIGGIVLARTRFGSNVYATGGDAEAARDNGIHTGRVKLICFILTGGLCALTGALQYGRSQMAPFSVTTGLELQVIAACIIGGVGLFGGRGTIFGTLIGVLFLSLLPAGLIMVGVQDFWEGVVLGVVILGAAGLDLIVRRAASHLLGRTAK